MGHILRQEERFPPDLATSGPPPAANEEPPPLPNFLLIPTKG